MYTLHEKGRKTPKYINVSIDTRTGDIWQIVFSSIVVGNANKYPKEVVFHTEAGYDLKKAVYDWLNEESKG